MGAMRTTWSILKTAVSRFMSHNAVTLGAALAFYTIFSLAPILIIVLGVVGIVWGEEAARGEIVQQVQENVGEDAAGMVQTVIANAGDSGQGIVAIVIGAVTVVIGATGVFAQLKQALNIIWNVRPKPDQGIWTVLRDRFLSFAMVLTIAFLLLVSLAANAALSAASNWIESNLTVPNELLATLQIVVSLAVIAGLFALIFRYLPDVEIQWRDVWVGAGATAVLFVVGESLLSWYLAQGTVASSYGAAGALVALLLWVYYSSLIFLMGAELTRAYSERVGYGIEPSANAMPRNLRFAGVRS